MSELRERLEEIQKLSRADLSVLPVEDIMDEIHDEAVAVLELVEGSEPVGRRSRMPCAATLCTNYVAARGHYYCPEHKAAGEPVYVYMPSHWRETIREHPQALVGFQYELSEHDAEVEEWERVAVSATSPTPTSVPEGGEG